MRVYLAHPITDYGTPRQAEAVNALTAMGFDIENPDQPHHQEGYAREGMAYFQGVVRSCGGLVFVRFPDSSIGAGVGKEIMTAILAHLNVWELFGGKLYWVADQPTPILSVEDTRETIRRIRGESA